LYGSPRRSGNRLSHLLLRLCNLILRMNHLLLLSIGLLSQLSTSGCIHLPDLVIELIEFL